MDSVQEVKSAQDYGNFPAINHTDIPLSRNFVKARLERIADCFNELLKSSGEDDGVRTTGDGFIEFYVRTLDLVSLHALKRFLNQTGTIDKYNLEHRSVKRDEDAEEISFIIAHPEIKLGELYKRTLPSLNPEHLDRHQLVRLIDKERLAAFWDYRDFIKKHGDEILTSNARRLLKAVECRGTLVVNEKNLIAKHGNERLKSQGFIPDRLEFEEHYLGFKFSDHRFFATNEKGEVESFLVIPNGRIHPHFPIGVGALPRKDELHTPKAVIKEHMCAAGLNQRSSPDDSIYGFIDVTPSAEPGSIVIIPTVKQAEEIAKQYHGKIESLIEGSVSSFHLDINTGRAITRSLIAGVEAHYLSKKIPTETLREIFSEQQEEERFHLGDRGGRKWKNVIRDEKGFPTPYIVLSLRTQFSGLTKEKLSGLSAESGNAFLTTPVFKYLNQEV